MNGRCEIEPRKANVRSASVSLPTARESSSGVNLNAKGEQLLLCCLSG